MRINFPSAEQFLHQDSSPLFQSNVNRYPIQGEEWKGRGGGIINSASGDVV